MDFSAFKEDIDELIQEFAERELTALSDMKKIWLDRKFSYIFEARTSTNLALFMQTLYNHSVGHMDIKNSLSRRLGAMYCLYCLYETQPFKPPFKIYLSIEELQRLKALVVDAESKGIKVVSAVVKRMLEKNGFLFGFVSINEYSKKERIKELVKVQNACMQKMNEKLFGNTNSYLHMDMGMELDLEVLLKISKEYAATKGLAIREASKVLDVQDIKHIAEDSQTIGIEVQKIMEEWGIQRPVFSQEITSTSSSDITNPQTRDSQREQRTPHPSSAETRKVNIDDDESQDISYLQLLLGNDSPKANDNSESNPANRSLGIDEEDTESEFAKELESQLFQDFF